MPTACHGLLKEVGVRDKLSLDLNRAARSLPLPASRGELWAWTEATSKILTRDECLRE